MSAEEGEPPYYLIEYLVESSRGRKVYLCKYCIYNQKLYVLQAQANVADSCRVAPRESTGRGGLSLPVIQLRLGEWHDIPLTMR